MIALPAGTQVWLVAGATDMRKGFDGLAALVQLQLTEDPFSGQLFVFRGRAGGALPDHSEHKIQRSASVIFIVPKTA